MFIPILHTLQLHLYVFATPKSQMCVCLCHMQLCCDTPLHVLVFNLNFITFCPFLTHSITHLYRHWRYTSKYFPDHFLSCPIVPTEMMPIFLTHHPVTWHFIIHVTKHNRMLISWDYNVVHLSSKMTIFFNPLITLEFHWINFTEIFYTSYFVLWL